MTTMELDQGTNDLVSNLDYESLKILMDLYASLSAIDPELNSKRSWENHDIVEIRVRALQCLRRKLDHGLIPGNILSKRIDLLNRLACWLRSAKWTEEELLLIIQFLAEMCQFEDFRKNFMKTSLDDLLVRTRLVVGADTRALIDRLLDTLRGRSFDFLCQGPPEIGNDNLSSRLPSSTTTSSGIMSSSRDKMVSPRSSLDKFNMNLKTSSRDKCDERVKDVDKENYAPISELQVYFKGRNLEKTKLAHNFGISTIRLDVSDRRVLASTIESLLSKNEELIHMTTCFVRDVLLNDFLAETFVQECSVSQSLVNVVQECWEDEKLNYAGFQALYKLSNLLRMRFATLDSSEFYSCQLQDNSQRQRSSTLTAGSRSRSQDGLPTYSYTSSRTSTDYFLSNLCQLVQTLLRAVSSKVKNIYLWILLDSFCYTLCVCVRIFNYDPTALSIQIQEILLDLCPYTVESKDFNISKDKEFGKANPPIQILALITTSLLSSFEDTSDLVLDKEIRRGMWNLALNPQLNHACPSVFQRLVEVAGIFEPKLEEIGAIMGEVCDSVEEIVNFLEAEVASGMTVERILKMIKYLNYIPIPNDVPDAESSLDKFFQKTWSLCTDSLYKEILPDVRERVSIILSLITQTNNETRVNVYSCLHGLFKKHFGPSTTSNKKNENIYVISTILTKEILEEILHFGLRDKIPDVEHFAEEIILFILRSRIIIGDDLWDLVLKAFSPLLQVLEVQADPQTVLGRVVLTFFDPTNEETELTNLELLAANMRFLFSCNPKIREEGSDRLMKLISSSPKASSNLRYSSYSNYTLSSVFNVGKNLEITDHMTKNEANPQYQVGFLLKQMKMAESDDLDSPVRRNALQQIAIILEDLLMQESFNKNDGLGLILKIVNLIVDESNFKFPLDFWPPAVRILKLMAMHSDKVCEILAKNEEILMNLIFGLLTLRSDDIFRIDVVHLVSLLLFCPYLRTSDDGKRFRLPQLLSVRCRIPINSDLYMDIGSHFSQHLPSTQPTKEFSLESIFQYWWNARKVEDVKYDPKTALIGELHAIQNATEHKCVIEGIENIWAQTLPLVFNTRFQNQVNIDQEVIQGSMHDCREAFSRFISVEPTCAEDEDLLSRVLDLFEFFLTYLKNPIELKNWIIPLVNQKASVISKVLLQHCLANEDLGVGTGTMMTAVVRSVFNFYSVLMVRNGNWLSSEVMWDLMIIFTRIVQKLSVDGWPSPAILHPVLCGLSNISAEMSIIEKLYGNHEFTLSLLDLLCDGLQLIAERTNPISYRNNGTILYGAMSVLHLTLNLKEEESWQWNVKCTKLIPFLWTSEDPRVRAIGFQISSVINSTRRGTIIILSEMESPQLLWKNAYANLIDRKQISLIRQKAACVLLNMITFWDEMVKVMNQVLVVPKWKILEDMAELLPNIYWHSKLSTEMKMSHDLIVSKQSMMDESQPLPLITPKLLSNIIRLIVVTVKIDEFSSSTIPAPQNFETILREICTMLLRLIGIHPLSTKMDITWWTESCECLNNVIKAITTILELDHKLAIVLTGDKLNIAALIKVFQIQDPSGDTKSKAHTQLSILWINVFILLTLLCEEAGSNFEDFEKLILIHRNVIFPHIIKSLDGPTPVKHRKVRLDFLIKFLQLSSEKRGREGSPVHKLWLDADKIHGENLCGKLVNLMETSLDANERISSGICCNPLYQVCPSAKAFVAEHSSVIGSLIKTIGNFGQKSINSNNLTIKNPKYCEEIVCTIQLLSSTLFESEASRNIALKNDLASALHMIYKTAISLCNHNLLHGIIECIVNFTDDFPKGSHSLTLTTGLVGVPSRKAPTPSSIFLELLSLLHSELDNIDKSLGRWPHSKTIGLLFSLIKNCVFSNECRNCLVKINILSFIKRLHISDNKKWGVKHQQVKSSFLNFLLDLSVHPDMQLFIAKLPESIEILVLLAESESTSSVIALEILRNLSFHPGNRSRFINDIRFMHFIVERLKTSENSYEIECVAVALWAIIANCEKGKVTAKRLACGANILCAIQRLRKKELYGKQLEDRDANLINILERVAHILSSSSSMESTSTGDSGQVSFAHS